MECLRFPVWALCLSYGAGSCPPAADGQYPLLYRQTGFQTVKRPSPSNLVSECCQVLWVHTLGWELADLQETWQHVELQNTWSLLLLWGPYRESFWLKHLDSSKVQSSVPSLELYSPELWGPPVVAFQPMCLNCISLSHLTRNTGSQQPPGLPLTAPEPRWVCPDLAVMRGTERWRVGWGRGCMNHSVQLLREFFHLYVPDTCHRSGVGILHHSYTLSQNSPLSLSASISETRCECPATMSGRKVCVFAFCVSSLFHSRKDLS